MRLTGKLLLIVVASVAAWHFLVRPDPLWTERRAQLEALMIADAVASYPPAWKDWNARAFVPVASLEAVAKQFIGAKFTLPLGAADAAGKHDGVLELALDSFDVSGSDAWLEASIDLTVRFLPERSHQEWSNVAAGLRVRAMIIPHQRDGQTFLVRVVPTEIAPRFSWRKWGFDTAEQSLVSEALAAGVVVSFLQNVLLPIDLPKPPVLSTKIASRDTTKFDGGGSTDVVVDYAGLEATLPLPFDVAVATPSGLWIIGRQRGASPLSLPTANAADATVERISGLRKQVAERLKEWKSPSAMTLEVAPTVLEDVAKALLTPGTPVVLQIKTENAQGDIGKIENVRSEYVDNASIRLRPASNTFASGRLTLTPAAASLTQTGLAVPMAAVLDAEATLNLHVRPTLAAMGDGIGITFGASGKSSTNLVATLTAENRPVASGRAVVLQPDLPCKRVQIDVTSEVDLLADKHRIGVRRHQHVGGDRMEPAILIDDIPRFVAYPPPSDDLKKKLPEAKLTWPAARIVLMFEPASASLTTTGLAVSTSVAVSRETDPDDSDAHKKRLVEFEERRKQLRDGLKQAASESECMAPEETALLANNVEVGPNNEAVKLLRFAVSKASAAAADGKARAEKWFKDVQTNPATPPPDFGQSVINQLLPKEVPNPPSSPSPPSPIPQRTDDGCYVRYGVKICP